MILAQNWPKTAKSSWHCSFKTSRFAFIKFNKMAWILRALGVISTVGLVTQPRSRGFDSRSDLFLELLQKVYKWWKVIICIICTIARILWIRCLLNLRVKNVFSDASDIKIGPQCVHVWLTRPLACNWREDYELEVGGNRSWQVNCSIWIKLTITYIANLILDNGRSNCWIFRSEGKHGLAISLQRWTLFHMMQVNKEKSELKILIYCLYSQLYKWLAAILKWLAAILCAWKVSDRLGSYTFSGFFKFEDPPLIFMNLSSTKRNVCVESYVLGINKCTCRNDRQWELDENTCKPDIHCALVAQWTCAKVTREQGEQKKRVFLHILWAFREFYCLQPEHLFSFTLKLISVDIFWFCSIKKSRTLKNQNQFQVLSRPLNQTPEIHRFSRRILTLKWKY